MGVRRGWFLVAVSVLLALPAAARSTSQTQQSVHKELAAVYARYTQAIRSGDAAATVQGAAHQRLQVQTARR
jgi:hypothetical protein